MFNRSANFLVFILLCLIIGCGGGGGGSSSDDDSASGASLSTLDLSIGLVNEPIDSSRSAYTATLSFITDSLEIRASANNGSVTVNGESVNASTSSSVISLQEGSNVVDIQVSSPDGSQARAYTLNITRQTQQQFAQSAFIKASNPLEGADFGAAVIIEGNTMVVGDTGSVYVFVNENGSWIQQAHLLPSATATSWSFGEALAMDGETLVVGDIREYSDANGIYGTPTGIDLWRSGAVYVFVRENGEWTEQAYIKAEEPIELDEFGFAVAIDGDDMVVGARGYWLSGPENSNFTNHHQGSAQVYKRTDGEWSFVTKLVAPFPTGGDHFGETVAIEGNIIAVGAHREDGNSQGLNGEQDINIGVDSGAVYIFENIADEWTLQTYVKSSDSDIADEFGYRINLHDDLLVVSSLLTSDDEEAESTGGVYLFSKSQGWNEIGFLKPSSSVIRFGECVATNGNYILVGASYDDGKGAGVDPDSVDFEEETHVGAAFLFELQNGIWSQVAYLKPSNPQVEGHFGESCAMSEAFLAVSADNDDSSGTGINPDQSLFEALENSGAVYVYPIN